MTINAIFIDVVFIAVDARNSLTLTGGVGEQRVAAQTEVTTTIDRQKFRIIRMIEGRSMTILTGDDPMQILGPDINHIVVAFPTVFVHLLFARVAVLERLILPDLLIGLVVVAIHEAVFT